MSKLLATFQERFGDWLTALGQHLQLSLLTLLLAIFLAVPLAIYLSTRKRASNWCLQVAGIFQTIPSMAFLGLFIPIMGIGTLPRPWQLSSSMPFSHPQIPSPVCRDWPRVLKKRESPLGWPSGSDSRSLRFPWPCPSSCLGFGQQRDDYRDGYPRLPWLEQGTPVSFILLGIDRNNASLILIGALSSAFLAIAFNLLLKWMEKAKLRTIFAAFCGNGYRIGS